MDSHSQKERTKEQNPESKTRMLERDISQRELAAGMGTHQARISEAITGKPSGKKFIIPLIQELGGNMDDFKDFLNTV